MSDQHIPLKKPTWLKVKSPVGIAYQETRKILKQKFLNTVCEEASCPNIGECWNKKHATFMIMGSICTRACRFCNVKTGMPGMVDLYEPMRIAESVCELGLRHVVITSVNRDDLQDGGASHFASCILEIKKYSPSTTVEVLTPDFLRKGDVYKTIIDAKPEVFNHNVETVPSLYHKVRPGSRYFNSLKLLNNVKNYNKQIFTKSGMMVGLGEKKEEVLQVMDDLRDAGVNFLTIGQYLQPTPEHINIDRYVGLDEFSYFKKMAKIKGFEMVSATPLTRSSYHAEEDFLKLKQNIVVK